MSKRVLWCRAITLALLAGVFGSASPAQAGGFFFQDRGTRPAGRGFAFVAGADDPQSLHYNPAGLAYSGQQLLMDASLMWFRGDYTRVDSGGNVQPTVDLHTVPIPIPGLAYSHPLSDQFTLGIGLLVPNALLGDYPDGVTEDGSSCNPDEDPGCQPAPQRYSVYSLLGTALAQLDLALAWRPHPKISFGAGLGVLVGNFNADVGLSACDNAICAQPENPDFDARATISLERFWDLAPHVGVILDFEKLRLGASLRFYPRGIQGTARLRVRLPADPFFNGAEINGNKARVRLEMPIIFRAGAEVRLFENRLRLEGAVVWERWSRQEDISLRPMNVTFTNITAIGDYAVGALSIRRDMNDTISLRVGGELDLGTLQMRGGLAFENSGFDDRTLTVMTIDSRKVTLGLGGSLRVMRGLYLDASYAHVFLQDRNVTNSAVERPSGIRPPIEGSDAVFLGNGRYRWEADMFAVGLRYQFDAGSRPDEPAEPQFPEFPTPEDPAMEDTEFGEPGSDATEGSEAVEDDWVDPSASEPSPRGGRSTPRSRRPRRQQ